MMSRLHEQMNKDSDLYQVHLQVWTLKEVLPRYLVQHLVLASVHVQDQPPDSGIQLLGLLVLEIHQPLHQRRRELQQLTKRNWHTQSARKSFVTWRVEIWTNHLIKSRHEWVKKILYVRHVATKLNALVLYMFANSVTMTSASHV